MDLVIKRDNNNNEGINNRSDYKQIMTININGEDFTINDFDGFEEEFIQLIAKYSI